MKSILGTVLVAVAASRLPSSADAFTTVSSASSFGIRAAPTSSLQATAAAETTAAIDYKFVRKEIDSLTKDNFDAKLKSIEPFLTYTAGASFHRKSLKRIARLAKVTGATVPGTFAKEAKATEKRRVKQNTFIEGKATEKEEAVAVDDEAAPGEEETAEIEEGTEAQPVPAHTPPDLAGTREEHSAAPADDVSTLTVVQLKERLRAAGLPVSGVKAV